MVKTQRALSKLSVLVAVIVVLVTLLLPVNASEAVGNEIGFSVSPVIPGNQITPGTGYFELKVEPGTQQTLEVTVTNTTSEEKQIEVEAISASTSSHGEVNYTKPGVKDDTLLHPFSEIADIESEQMRVPAQGTATARIDVSYPEEEFDGIILGGIRLKDITARLQREESSEDSAQAGMEIYNEFEYVIGVVLRENNQVVIPDFELLPIYSDTVNYRASIIVPIRNTESTSVGKALFSGEVTKKGDSSPMFTVNEQTIDMAPNSVMNYRFADNAGYGISGGDYTFTGSIVLEDKTWDLNQDFTIEKAEADQMNKQAVNQQTQSPQKDSSVGLYVLIALAAVFIIVLLVIILRMRKTHK